MPGIPYQNPYPDLPGDDDHAKRERTAFYTGTRWRKLRPAFLAKHPLCARCQAAGRTTEAKIVHHVKDRLLYPELAYSTANLEGLCSTCHTKGHKTKGPRRG